MNKIKELREKYYEKQNFKCKILNIKLEENEKVLDHIHSSHKSIYPNSAGNCRGVIHRDINVLIGKIENQWLRTSKKIKENFKLSDILRKIADYIDEDYSKNELHPKEKKKEILLKSDYNKLKKIFEEKYNKKFVEYPKSGKKTKKIKEFAKSINFEFRK